MAINTHHFEPKIDIFFSTRKGKSYHRIDKHRGMVQYDVYRTQDDALKHGLVPCKRCLKGGE